MHETFWNLLRDSAHWEFEIFLNILIDGLIIGLGWPFVRKHWQHHLARDQRERVQNWSMSSLSKAAGHVEYDVDERNRILQELAEDDSAGRYD